MSIPFGHLHSTVPKQILNRDQIHTIVAPAEDFLDKRKADELFPEKQREDLMGEDFLDKKFT